jgi:Phosphatidylinositol 3- and 4-kinase
VVHRINVLRPVVLLLAASTFVLAQDTARATLPWLASPDSIAEYIRTAPVQKVEPIPVGVTRPQRAILAPGGPVGSIVVKDLPPGRKGGFWESYKAEIAAYELDRMLELNMVPPTVEKRVNGTIMSAQMFVERCVWLKELKGQQAPDVEAWNRQVHRHRVFDNLIANIDRNAGNLLVYRGSGALAGRPDWNLVLIDHSRCFTTTKKMQFPMTKIDRPLFEHLKALDKPTLQARLGKLIDGIDAILQRRDIIVKHFEELAATKGEALVFIP